MMSTWYPFLLQLTNNRRSDFCQPSPTTSHYTAADPAESASVNGSILPTAVVALIGALAFVMAAILASLGVHTLWRWKRRSAVSAIPAVPGWPNFCSTLMSEYIHSVYRSTTWLCFPPHYGV